MDETLTTYDGCHARVAPAYGPRGAWTVAYVWSGEDPPSGDDIVRVYVPRTPRTDRENGIPEGCRLVIPADCQSDPWGLEGRWVNAETGEDVLPPDPPGYISVTEYQRDDGRWSRCGDEVVMESEPPRFTAQDAQRAWTDYVAGWIAELGDETEPPAYRLATYRSEGDAEHLIDWIEIEPGKALRETT